MFAETAERVLGQMVLLSGLLVGFSLTVVINLLPLRERSRLVSAVIATFLLSGALLLYAAMVGTLTMAYPLESLGANQFARLARFYPFMQWPFRLGLLAFLSGLGLSGWVRSRRMGLASSAVALVVFVAWLAWALAMRSIFGR